MMRRQVVYLAGLALLFSAASLRAQTIETYLDQASQHSAAILNRSDGPCNDDSDVPFEVCMTKELALVEQHLDALVKCLRASFRAKQSSEPTELETLNKADAAWRIYREQICKLSFNYFASGPESKAYPEPDMCRLRLDRAYVIQLNPLILQHTVVK